MTGKKSKDDMETTSSRAIFEVLITMTSLGSSCSFEAQLKKCMSRSLGRSFVAFYKISDLLCVT